jgi:hypothetical protein
MDCRTLSPEILRKLGAEMRELRERLGCAKATPTKEANMMVGRQVGRQRSPSWFHPSTALSSRTGNPLSTVRSSSFHFLPTLDHRSLQLGSKFLLLDYACMANMIARHSQGMTRSSHRLLFMTTCQHAIRPFKNEKAGRSRKRFSEHRESTPTMSPGILLMEMRPRKSLRACSIPPQPIPPEKSKDLTSPTILQSRLAEFP